MERKHQLANVSFGGAWSEQIAGREEMSRAMSEVERAAAAAMDEDIRDWPQLREHLSMLAAAHPKGVMLGQAWLRAAGWPEPVARHQELLRIAQVFRAGLGARLVP